MTTDVGISEAIMEIAVVILAMGLSFFVGRFVQLRKDKRKLGKVERALRIERQNAYICTNHD